MGKPTLDTVVLAFNRSRRIFRKPVRHTKKFVAYILLSGSLAVAQTSTSTPSSLLPQQGTAKSSPLSQSEISQLQNRAEAGDASAQSRLGKAYQEGDGVPQNNVLAAKWFRKAADQGDPVAENSLGTMYRIGEGVAGDKEDAVRWYKKAAKQKNPKAMFNLGASYYNGDGVAIDEVASWAWFLLAQEAGNTAADEALQRADAEKKTGPSEPLEKVAQMYEAGQELPQDSAEALKWYRKAADAGSAQAGLKVSSILLASRRVPTADEYSEIRRRCEDAAKAALSKGAYCLALIYGRGAGTPKDPVESTKWLGRAAELGSSKAALEFGEACWKGVGVKPDLVTAYMWIWLALGSDEPGAAKAEQDLAGELSKKQVKQGKEKAAEWWKLHTGLRIRTAANPSSK